MTPYRHGDRIDRVVAFHAGRSPDAVAVQQGRRTLTYAELDQGADAVAAALRAQGVGRGDFVATRLDRSPELVTVLLAVLRTGAAYVAMDMGWPDARVEDTIARCGARVVVDQDTYPDLRAGHREPVRATPGTGADPACVFFTSGSTGRPKGVLSPHRGTIRTLVGHHDIPLDHTTVFLQAAPLPWDGMALDLWAPLLNGGRGVLLDRGATALDMAGLRAAVGRGVNSLWLTSSLFNVLVDEDVSVFDGVRLLLTGGERVSVAHARRVLARFPGLRLVNGYGPAENTIFTTTHVVRGADVADDATELPIGRPVPRTGILVLSAAGTPVTPADVDRVGELAVSGDGLALGYVGDPEETARAFFERDGVRHYRTGDLVCFDHAGALRYRGRVDRQVKINGVRVEPGEVEAVLETHPRIASCCVFTVQRAPGRTELACLYSTVDEQPLDDVRAVAARRLVSAMVPTLVKHVRRLPLGANGKADLKAAAALFADQVVAGGSVAGTADRSALAVARELLGQPGLSEEDDLVAAGMTSLDAIRLAARLSAATGTDVTIADIYLGRTLGGIRGGPAPGPAVDDPPATAGPAPLSHAQERFWMAEQMAPGAADNVLVHAYVLSGPLAPEVLQEALHDVVARHPILRTRYPWADDGPTPEVLAVDVPIEQVQAPDPDVDPRALAEHLTADWWDLPFDVEKEPPLRVRLCRVDAETHVLCARIHHIAFDGRSEQVFVADLCAAYASRRQGTVSPPVPTAGHDAHARRERAEVDHWARVERPYWQRTFGTVPPPCLPAPPRPSDEDTRAEAVRHVPATAVRSLTSAAGRHGGPALAALVAATGQALSRVLGVADVCLGAVADGRNRPDTDTAIGYFVNPLAVPLVSVAGRAPADLLAHAVTGVVSAFRHARTPFDRLVRDFQPDRGRHPWFQAWVVLQYEPPGGNLGPRTTMRHLRLRPPRTTTELAVEAFPQRDGSWELVVSWRADGCDESTATSITNELVAALADLTTLEADDDAGH